MKALAVSCWLQTIILETKTCNYRKNGLLLH